MFGWALEYAAEAERSGWDELWTTEDHFVPAVQSSSALTLAAFLLGRTPLSVGTGVCVLPNHHPVALAEQAAVLHHLSGGRFTLGVGRGVPRADLEILGTGMAGHEDTEESLTLLANTLREGKAAGVGPRYEFGEVQLVPDAPERVPLVQSAASPASARLALFPVDDDSEVTRRTLINPCARPSGLPVTWWVRAG
ncbi:LLM class flavin-dependent oxidoreductase [Amycolatopsis acidicola]|uniref:LLM class flavin-dependent oxidoreductase n=1 Tax=Amycolatopsis acidicola TaxID=2596893 RepID=A0A5N0V226_9PSEU|nr:LLM class flavin-dependent oxidoreductase [Amycolatopsis acidicola]KAA9158929.1 LLM class flavin-dependent oxidoreductase [Amycolatopsis acidicola]